MKEVDEEVKKLIKQNEIIISLLGRLAFTVEKVRGIVTSRKRDREAYIRGYNACNGSNTVTKIAEIVEVNPGTISPILQEWEELGIVYEVERGRGRFYKKLFPI